MAELEELEQAELDEKMLEIGPALTDDLPSVPSSEPAAASKFSELYTTRGGVKVVIPAIFGPNAKLLIFSRPPRRFIFDTKTMTYFVKPVI